MHNPEELPIPDGFEISVGEKFTNALEGFWAIFQGRNIFGNLVGI